MTIFEELESAVRSYCRAFPSVFSRAQGALLVDENGREYIDFFAGAGALNYGHNNPRFKQKLIEYIEQDGVTHSLDMATEAKRCFLQRFHERILEPRGLRYRVQFTGPTGTNAVEAALKLARKATGRPTVVYFSRSFHGMTMGSLSVCGNPRTQSSAGVSLNSTHEMPFEADLGAFRDLLEKTAENERPAAIILETIQAEGGIRAASAEWLRGVEALSREHGIVFIVDDIQVGCGRTGRFFSFEEAGLRPDVVCLSKSISGFGLPMALLLIKPEIDCWDPGEHTGTFRGNNLAFVTATQALDYWEDQSFTTAIETRTDKLRHRLEAVTAGHPRAVEVRGRGLIQGLVCDPPDVAKKVSQAAFERGLIIETAGPNEEVLKFLPPLVIEEETLDAGLDIIEESFDTLR